MPWCAWKSFGGKLTSAPNCVVKRDGRLEVFARGSDGLVWHIWQHEPMGKWSQWSMMNGTGTSEVTVVQNKDGRMQAFIIGADHALHTAWQEKEDGDWTTWQHMGGQFHGSPAAVEHEHPAESVG